MVVRIAQSCFSFEVFFQGFPIHGRNLFSCVIDNFLFMYLVDCVSGYSDLDLIIFKRV